MNINIFKIMYAFSLKIVAIVLTIAIFVNVFFISEYDDYKEEVEVQAQVQVTQAEDKNKIEETKKKVIATPNPNTKLIALTFDDGPKSGVTDRILNTLEKYNAKATFFVIGRQIDEENKLIKRTVKLGCEIGNHTWEHRAMTKYTAQDLKTTLKRTNHAVEKYTGYNVKYVRPTYGVENKKVIKNVDAPMIAWNVDPEDWKSMNSKIIQKNVVGKVKDGDIIILHDIYTATADAIEKIIPRLLKQGYEFVTISELMERKGIKPKKGKIYYSGK